MFNHIKYAYNHIKLRALPPTLAAVTSSQPRILSLLKTIEQGSISIFKIFLILFLIYFLSQIIQWIIEKDDGLVIKPFEISNMAGELDGLDGKSLAALLRFDLQNINDIWAENINKKGDDSSLFSFPNLSINNEALEYSISALGDVNLEGSSFSLGNMLFSMKELSGKRASTISCSLQKSNSTIFAVAILEDHYPTKNTIRIFQAKKTLCYNSSVIEQIPDLINDLAYQLSLDISKRRVSRTKDEPKNWQAFKYMTQGRNAYIDYIMTNNFNDLDNATNLTLRSIEFETSWKRSSDQLSNLGFCYLENNESKKAKNIFLNANTMDNFNRSLGLGIVYGYDGEFNKSLVELNNAIRLNNHSAIAWYNRGVALNGLRRYEEAIQSYNQITNETPNYAHSMYNKGCALHMLGRYPEAIEAYDEAIRFDKDHKGAWINKGNDQALLHNYDEAVKAYDEAIRLNYNDAVSWCNKGMALNSVGKYVEGLQACNEAIESNPNLADAWNSRGRALYYLGYYEESIRDYKKAISLKPRWAIPWNNKGEALTALERYNESIDAYNKAININSTWAKPWNNKGEALIALGRYNESIDAYDKAIDFNSTWAEPWNNKGGALTALERYNESIDAYNKAIDFNSTWAEPWNNKGIALNKQGKNGEAIKAFDKALELNSSFIEARINKGIALISQGKYNEAIEDLRAFP